MTAINLEADSMSAIPFCRRLVATATLAIAALPGVGCGGGDQGAVIEFPEASAPPKFAEGAPATGDTGVMSQGDPASYSR
ncbi:hypothetical protein [Tautonia sociabilis]|uniref:Uncharacterized protein n=1 Tax=Tautonia sociabilis TaxID=2080755 RepID=A0A432MH46_9BACT|nr:hypothetical protein [Tautonia sociabilis]RUL86265.1 hypothetical protein TsocGM_16150 [Tautonia sociabilis]